MVERAQLIEAAEMLRQVGGGSTSLALDVKQMADRRADAVILQAAGAAGLAAFAPVAGVALETTIVAAAIVRIARIYGVSLTRKEAGKFAVDMAFALGFWQASALLGEKVLATAIEATGAGYVGAATLDSVFTAAVAFALCTAAKLYFGSGMKKGDLRRVVRSSFRQARKRFRDPRELRTLTTTARMANPSYDHVSQILRSRFGRDILQRLALTTPLVATDLADYLQTTQGSAQALTPAALKRLDEESGLIRELWSLAQSSVETDRLLRLAAEPDSALAPLDMLAGLPGGDKTVALMPEPSARHFVFPPGHPAPHVIYARHPLAPHIFYPLAHFHRLTFEHKVCEALVLLESLGARQLSVHHVTGMSSDVAASVTASFSGAMKPGSSPAPSNGPDIVLSEGSAAAVARSSESSEMLFEATYEGHAPTMPDRLVWYEHEPAWQHIAEARLHRGLSSFNLHVRYTDSFGIDGQLAAGFRSLPGLGAHLSLGGAFHDFEATEWHITGMFGDDPPGEGQGTVQVQPA
jgi:uncharacterized protein (DUF697 family)